MVGLAKGDEDDGIHGFVRCKKRYAFGYGDAGGGFRWVAEGARAYGWKRHGATAGGCGKGQA